MPEYTDIPIVEGPINEQTGEYSFVLPTRFNDDESNVTIVFPSSVSKPEALAEIRESFPRNSADTQVQKMTDPDWYTKISKDDYLQFKADENKYPGQDVGLGTLLYEGAKDLLKGIGYLGKELGSAAVNVSAPGTAEQRMAARHAWNAVEGFMQGNERLGMLAGLLSMKMGDVAMSPFRDSESNTDADFQRWVYAQEMGKTMAARAQGQMITEGGQESPVFGNANFKPENIPSATEYDAKAARAIGNVFDVVAFLPLGGAMEKAGAAMGNTMFKYVAPTALANIAAKTGFAATRMSGTALDEASKLAFNQITNIAKAVGEGAVTNAGKAVSNYATKAALYGGLLFAGPGGWLIGASLAGKGMRALGEVGGAVMSGLEEGGVRLALTELSENQLKAATVRKAARMAVAIAPPDAAMTALKGVVDSAVTTGAVMGGLNAMSAWASNDDPIKAFKEGVASGMGFGLSIGAIHAPFGMTGQDKIRLANMFDNDIRGRELTKSFSVTQPSGHVETVNFNDLQGRVDFFNREDLSARQKALTLALTQGHELGGGNVIFVDGSPESAALMEKIGFGGTKGVHYFDGSDGRSTILIDSKNIDPATAAEEVMHSLYTENIRKEVVQGVQAGLKSENPVQAVEEISKFGMRYAAEMEAAGHGERAAEMRDTIAQALDPAVPMETKLGMLDGVINEYASNYVGAAIHGMKPDIFLEGNIRNIWDKVWDKTVSNILSTFDFTKNGLTKDPIKGHFFDERGKRVIMPEMESLVGRFVEAVREGRGEIASKDTVDGAHYVDVRTEKPYVSPEDFTAGRPTTFKEKKQILKSLYEDNIAAASAIDPNLIVIADPASVESGMFGGNLTGLKNKQVLFSRGLPDEFFAHLAGQEVAGKKVYTPAQIEALKGINEAMKAGHIVMQDAWHDIRRTKGDRTEVYYGRTSRPSLPVSWQQTETGGLLLNQIDIGRVWHQMRYFAKYEPKLRAELASKGIKTFSDVIPYIQRYFDNYSSGAPKPAASLPGFSEVLRDGISRALDLKNRKAFMAEDMARFANEHTFDATGFPAQPMPVVEVNGIRREVSRDSVSMQFIRSDRILGLNDFTVDGFNVPIKYDPALASNLVRANFAPGSTTREQMPNGEILTDKATGNRIIVGKTGKASLYEGDRRSIYGSVDEAIAAADKRSVANFAPKRKGDEKLLYRNFKETFPNFEQMSSVERDVVLRKWMREHSGVSPFELSGLGAQNLLRLQEAVRGAKPQTINAEVKRSEEFRAKTKAHDSLMAKIRSAYKRAAEGTSFEEIQAGGTAKPQPPTEATPREPSGNSEYSKWVDSFPEPRPEDSASARRNQLGAWSDSNKNATEMELRGLGEKNLRELEDAVKNKPIRYGLNSEGVEISKIEKKEIAKQLSKIRAAIKYWNPESPSKIADTMESLAHKPEASNQSIALAVDKAYQAGEIPLEVVHATKAKLAEAVDENYVAKRYEAMDTAKGAAPAMTQEEFIAQQEAELKAAGMRVPNYDATPEEISAADTRRHDTEVTVREKELRQNRGMTDKQKAFYAERSDKQSIRMEEQTNRMLNNARAEALAQGKQAMQRSEAERISSRKEGFVEALKAERESKLAARELDKAKIEAEKYLKEEERAAKAAERAALEEDAKKQAAAREAEVQARMERREGFSKALTEQYYANIESAAELRNAKKEAKKYLAEEARAERERVAQEKEAADKLAAENKAKRDADLAERRLGFEELLKEKAKSEREYQRDLRENLKRSERANKLHAEERAARASEDAKLAEKEALRVKLRTMENAKHATAMEELLKEHDTAELGETTSKGTEVVDPKIPHNIRIIITPTRKLRVYLPTGALVGVTDSYKEALKVAQRNAPKKVSIR